MDAADLRAAFPVFERVAYLNSGSDGPLPLAAVQAARATLTTQLEHGRVLAHFETRAQTQEALRSVYAARLGADPADVALTTSTSEGLGKVLAGLELRAGDEVLTSDAEHPGLLGPLLALRERGVTIRTGPLPTLADHVTAATSLVACSHVGWRTGDVADPRLGATGTPLVLDGAQGVGAVAVDVTALNCLAYAGPGQKWLCGADGTGMLYVRPGVFAAAPPYAAFTDSAAGLESGLVDDARRHDTPALAHEVTATSLAAAEVLADFGFDALLERGQALAALLAERLAAAGRTVGPRGATTLVAWEDPEPASTAQRLAASGVVIRDLPGTPYLRASVGAFNDESDLDRLLETL